MNYCERRDNVMEFIKYYLSEQHHTNSENDVNQSHLELKFKIYSDSRQESRKINQTTEDLLMYFLFLQILPLKEIHN